jgi:hypothetical protein
MRTYVVYDRQTSAIVHIHKVIDDDLRLEPTAILSLVRSAFDQPELDVVEIESVPVRGGRARLIASTQRARN